MAIVYYSINDFASENRIQQFSIIISMQVKQKISLEKSIFERSDLKEMIQKWFRGHSIKVGQNFKISVKKMRALDTQFQMKCIEYILLRKFSWTLKDFQQENLIQLNNYLKKTYQRLLIGSFFSSENTFQFFIIYIVKLSSFFLQQSFSNLMVDLTLESQNFIVLYYMFLGVEMKEKTYEIIQRKYMKLPLKNIKQSICQKQFRVSKNSFLQSFLKIGTKANTNNKLRKSQQSVHQSHQSFCRPIKESFFKQANNDISAIIKENLHVNPLPPVQPKKIKIRELQRLKTEPNPSEDSNRNSYQKENIPQQAQQKRMYIYSNQLSSSLKSLHPDQFFFELASKKTKINRSFYDNSFKENIQSIGLVNQRKIDESQSLHKKQAECCKNEQRKSIQWVNIVGELKKKVFGIRYNGVDKQKILRKSEDRDEIQFEDEQKSHDLSVSSHEIRAQITDSNKVPKTMMKKERKQRINIDIIKQGFKKAATQSLKIECYQQKNEECGNSFIKCKKKFLNNRKITKKKIKEDQNNFFNQCKARIGSIEELQCHNLQESWNFHQLKEGNRFL